MPFKMQKPSPGREGTLKHKKEDEQRLRNLRVRSGMHGRVDVCIYKVSNDAGNSWRRFEGANAALWQVSLAIK